MKRMKKVNDPKLMEILDALSGILDGAYEYFDDDEERETICKVENDLHEYLRKAGLLK
jgi:hypothetical protein